MNGAWDAMQRAKEDHDRAWDETTANQSRYGHRIESLKTEHDRTFDQMQSAFQAASDAFSRGDHDEAARRSSEGRDLKTRLPGLVSERRGYIDKCKRAQDHHRSARDVYKAKQRDFHLARERFNDRKAELEGARRDAAVRAGVPSHYGHEVKVKVEPHGVTSVYFGGIGTPDGPGHAHYVVDQSGKITWRRDPFENRGPHNAR
jgi:hypothetical protein